MREELVNGPENSQCQEVKEVCAHYPRFVLVLAPLCDNRQLLEIEEQEQRLALLPGFLHEK